MELTKEYLQSIFDYKDGKLFWKVKKAQRLNIGDEAGCLDKGYLTTGLNGKVYRNHRLIFLMHHGYLPKEVDHKDNDQLNNRIENLRPATRSQNCSNKEIGTTNTSGVKGVSWSKHNNKWRAKCKINGKTIHLGYYTDLESAKEDMQKFREKLHGDFARQN